MKDAFHGPRSKNFKWSDVMGVPTPLPNGYVMYCISPPQPQGRRRGPPPGLPIFPVFGVLSIEWAESYEVWFNDRAVLTLHNQRQQQVVRRGNRQNKTGAYELRPGAWVVVEISDEESDEDELEEEDELGDYDLNLYRPNEDESNISIQVLF
ncbi:hypothetical protein BASA81_003117 [Batrachochytrium salamandrivorans]|nr:hypothetical protein BASA81_003117 [Batrachochytrium salamandrivorans]